MTEWNRRRRSRWRKRRPPIHDNRWRSLSSLVWKTLSKDFPKLTRNFHQRTKLDILRRILCPTRWSSTNLVKLNELYIVEFLVLHVIINLAHEIERSLANADDDEH